MKWLKWTLLGAGALLVLLVVLVVTFLATFDANAYKAEFAAAVKTQTGRVLQIDGDIGVSLFPWLGFESGPVRLGNAPGFGADPFAQVSAVRVKVEVLPLLRRVLSVDVIELAGLRLDLQRRRDGVANWDDLAGSSAPAGDPAPTPSDRPAAPSSGSPIAALALGGIQVTDAAVRYRDAQSGQDLSLRDVSLMTGKISLGEAFEIALSATTDVREPTLKVKVDLVAGVTVDLDAQRYALTDVALKADLAGDPIPGGQMPVSLSGNIEADLAAQVVKFRGLHLVTDFLNTTIQGQLTELDQTPRFAFSFEVPPFDARQVLKDLAQVELDTTDKDVLTQVGVAAKLSGSASGIDLESLLVNMDDSRLEASASVRGLDKAQAPPVIRARAAIDRIDLDRYLPPPAEAPPAGGTAQSGAASGAGAAAGETPIGLPVELLRELDLVTRLDIAALTVSRLQASGLEATLTVKNGVANLEPLALALYEGGLQGKARVDVRGAQPTISTSAKLDGVQAGPLLVDYMGDDKLSGLGEANLALTTRGDTIGALKRGLNGPVALAFRDGAIKDFNLAEVLREAQAKIKGDSYQSSGMRATDFSSLTVSGHFTNGVMVTDDLDLRSPLLRVGGKGQIDVGRETLNYLATVTLIADTTGQGGAGAADLRGLPIPLRVKGPFDDPQVKIELARALEARARKELADKTQAEKKRLKAELDRKAKKEQKKAEEKLKKSLEEKLKKLF